MISARVVADSIASHGIRLTTMVLRYPRFIHSELMTHRTFSRNAASSRAIPIAKMIKQVQEDPAMPVYWGLNQPGMQAAGEIGDYTKELAIGYWLKARDNAVTMAEALLKLGLHKQIPNRVLETWMWMETIVSSTYWANFYALRRSPAAQPEFRELADRMHEVHTESVPTFLEEGDWHLPFVSHSEVQNTRIEELLKYSAARVARVSYLNHDGTAPNPQKDIALHNQLAEAPHASPFEHVATPADGYYGNFYGWKQYRQFLPNNTHTTYGDFTL